MSGRWLDYAQFVAVWIGQDLPPKAELSYRLIGDEDAACRPDPLHLRPEFAGAQVKMHPVLGRLRIPCALQQQLQAGALRWEQAQILPDGRADPPVAKNITPERG